MKNIYECEWVKDLEGVVCKWCSTKRAFARIRVCDNQSTHRPVTLRKIGRALAGMVSPNAKRYYTAVEKWEAAGSPTRTEEEIARIFAVCESCPNLVPGTPTTCRLCGCWLSKQPDGLSNKIAMATEDCPDRPSRWAQPPVSGVDLPTP